MKQKFLSDACDSFWVLHIYERGKMKRVKRRNRSVSQFPLLCWCLGVGAAPACRVLLFISQCVGLLSLLVGHSGVSTAACDVGRSLVVWAIGPYTVSSYRFVISFSLLRGILSRYDCSYFYGLETRRLSDGLSAVASTCVGKMYLFFRSVIRKVPPVSIYLLF